MPDNLPSTADWYSPITAQQGGTKWIRSNKYGFSTKKQYKTKVK